MQVVFCDQTLSTGLKKCKRKRLLPANRPPRKPNQQHSQAVAANLCRLRLDSQLRRKSTTCRPMMMMITQGTSWTKMVSRFFPTSFAARHSSWVESLAIVELWFDISSPTMGRLCCWPGRFLSTVVVICDVWVFNYISTLSLVSCMYCR